MLGYPFEQREDEARDIVDDLGERRNRQAGPLQERGCRPDAQERRPSSTKQPLDAGEVTEPGALGGAHVATATTRHASDST